MEVISKKGNIQKEELVSVFRMEIIRKYRLFIYITIIILSLILCGSIYFYIFKNTAWFLTSWGPLGGVIILWWIYISLYWPKSSKFYKLNKSALVPAVYKLSEESFTVESDDGNYIKIPLKNFYELINLSNFIVLWENPTSVQIIPLRLFTYDEKMKAVEFIKQAKNKA